jgi:bleomycin hydrolase
MFRTHGIKKHLNKLGTKGANVPKPKPKIKAAEAGKVDVVVVPIGIPPSIVDIDNDTKKFIEIERNMLKSKLNDLDNEKEELETQMKLREKNEEDGRDITFEKSMAIVADTEEDAAFLLMKNVPLDAVDEDSTKAANIMERHWDVDTGIKVPSNQLYSGRCWMFAGLNILVRQLINVRHFAPTFELSQSYLFFWHYVEQYNDVLSLFHYKPELHQPFNRERNDILEEPLHDGANWINFYRLVKKYGVVPKSMMPETIPSSSSSEMKDTLADMLATDLKEMEETIPILDTTKTDEEQNELREQFNNFRNTKMIRVIKLLCKYMGKPPLEGSIKLNTVSNLLPLNHPDNNNNSSVQIKSPQAFFNAINTIEGTRIVNGTERQIKPVSVDDLVQIINDTREPSLSPYDKRLNDKDVSLNLQLSLDKTWYTTNYQEHKVHRNLLYNLKDMDIITEMVLLSLQYDKPVWFACNINTNVDKMRQGMDVDLFRPDLFTGFKLDMNRETRMKYGRAHCNHAMLIVGAETEVVKEGNVPKRKVVAFNIENSWGSKGPNGGFYKMSIEWFKARVYTVVIHKKIISAIFNEHNIRDIKEPTATDVLGIYPTNDFFS